MKINQNNQYKVKKMQFNKDLKIISKIKVNKIKKLFKKII